MPGLALLICLPLLALPAAYFWWLRRLYRPPATDRTVTPSYEPPAGLTPAEAAVLVNGSLKPSAMAATVLDLARRGILEVTSENGQVVALTRRESAVPLAAHERLFLDAVFRDAPTVTAGEAAATIRDRRLSLELAVKEILRAKGLTEEHLFLRYLIFGGACGGALVIAFGLLPVLGLIGGIGIAAAALLMAELPLLIDVARPHPTAAGRQALADIYGFRWWLSAAEGGRLRWSEKNEHDLGRLAPYAAAFGVTEHWPLEMQQMTKSLIDKVF